MNEVTGNEAEASLSKGNDAGDNSRGITEALVATAVPAAEETVAQKIAPSRANPYPVPLVEKRSLTHEVSSKLTVHLAFSLVGSPVVYEAGDSCGILATNNPRLVDETLRVVGFNGSESVNLDKVGSITLHDALLNHLTITRISRRMVQNYATRGQCKPLLGMLVPEQSVHLDQYLYGREVIDLLLQYPGVVQSPADLVAMLPKSTPRLYSIASSPLAHAGEVHLTVAVVRYRTHDRERGGVVSTLLSDRVDVGQSLPVYIQPNKRFRLPKDGEAPIIMIGPGTGVAPFRSFLFERLHAGAKGRNWLFFGERSAATDFLYRDEWETMVSSGHLTRFDTAFSRDQERKIYVQDRMLEKGADFWNWLQDGASIYVCGDATRMAKDVDHALLTIVTEHGRMEPEAAREYMQVLKNQHRYHRDVY